MKIDKLTDEQIKSLDFKAMQWNELKSDDYRMLRSLIAEIQEYRKEIPGGLFELQNIKSDARAISTRLGEALTRNSELAIQLKKLNAAGSQNQPGDDNQYVYHYCGLKEDSRFYSGIVQLSYRIVSKPELDAFASLLSEKYGEGFKEITSLSYLGRVHDA